ncbi:MAG: DUF4058 family protein [Armatimonadetes bacterium]|nr:DUF4058 family protein [Armatimonadota bacterium]
MLLEIVLFGLDRPGSPPLLRPERIEEPRTEIRLRDGQQVTTVIELLSPWNKRKGGNGRSEYLAKRDSLLASSVHLVELDLLRGGATMPMARTLPQADHYVIVILVRLTPNTETVDGGRWVAAGEGVGLMPSRPGPPRKCMSSFIMNLPKVS